jgi:D-beta-D-heptose 7-phosphate kinase/D-beta-D-heptose 1-phosphate adenosyltransferase
MKSSCNYSLPKILRETDLTKVRSYYNNKTIVLATGCFDLLHKGHVYFLKKAASQGDVLIVGLNADDSVRDLKGAGRPIITAADRCAVLAEFVCVDHVFTFVGTCVSDSMRILCPDVLAIGTESVERYPDEINTAHEVKARVHPIPKIDSTSTTGIIDSIEERKSKTLVSVVYVNWNTRDLLAASLESLRKYS